MFFDVVASRERGRRVSEVVKISLACGLKRVASFGCTHVDSVGLRFLPRRRLRFFCLDGTSTSIGSALSPLTELAAERKSVSSSNSMLVSVMDDHKYGSCEKEV